MWVSIYAAFNQTHLYTHQTGIHNTFLTAIGLTMSSAICNMHPYSDGTFFAIDYETNNKNISPDFSASFSNN